MKNIFNHLMSLSITALAQIILWIILFSTPILDDKILMFRGVGLMVLSTAMIAISFAIIALVRNRISKGRSSAILKPEGIVSGLVTGASVALCFFTVIPVTLDRSVTTFLLSRMANHPSLSKAEIHDILIQQYIDEYDAVGRRMSEQIASGNVIELSPNNFSLTKSGRVFINISNHIADIFGVQKKYILQNENTQNKGQNSEKSE